MSIKRQIHYEILIICPRSEPRAFSCKTVSHACMKKPFCVKMHLADTPQRRNALHFGAGVALLAYYGISNAYATATKCFAFWSWRGSGCLLWYFKCICHSDKRKTRLTLSHESGLLKCRLGSMYIFYYSCFHSRKRVTEFIRT